MPYPNKYENPSERIKLWVDLTKNERKAVFMILQARNDRREEEFYRAKRLPKSTLPKAR